MLRRLVLRKLAAFVAGLAAAGAISNAAPAADYPARPVTIVVAFTPGGPSDVLSRIIGKRLQEILHQPFIVENRPGAGGNIAAEQVKNAAPDGYTLLMGNNSILATTAALYKRLSYDARRISCRSARSPKQPWRTSSARDRRPRPAGRAPHLCRRRGRC